VKISSAVVIGFAVVGAIGPLLIPADQVSVIHATGPILAPPSLHHPFGTDENGVSILALTLRSTRLTLLIALSATAATIAIATVVGVLAGHFNGLPATVLGRVTEWFLVLPQLPFTTALAAVLRPGVGSIVLALAVTSWASAARTIEVGVRGIETMPYLEPARALSASHWHQLRRHVLPAVRPLLLANTLLIMANAILAESTLAYFGLGDPSRPSWGAMLRQAATAGAVTAGAWWYLLAPGLAIMTLVLGVGACARRLEAEPRFITVRSSPKSPIR
jgi:peptide/nickel transport system permease protein